MAHNDQFTATGPSFTARVSPSAVAENRRWRASGSTGLVRILESLEMAIEGLRASSETIIAAAPGYWARSCAAEPALWVSVCELSVIHWPPFEEYLVPP